MYSCILVPIEVAFDVTPGGAMSSFDVLVDVVFWMDLFFNLNTGFKTREEEGLVVDRRWVLQKQTGPRFHAVVTRVLLAGARSRRRIFTRYAKRLLIIDFFAVFPFQTLAPSANMHFASTCS